MAQATERESRLLGGQESLRKCGKEAVSSYLAIPTPGITYMHTAMLLLPFLYALKLFIHAGNHSDWLLACVSDSGA